MISPSTIEPRRLFRREDLILYLMQIGCTAIGRGEFTRFNAPWEAFAIALATREGFNVEEVKRRVSMGKIDGVTILSDSELIEIVDDDPELVSRDIERFRQMFVNLGEPAGSVQTLIDRDK
jgi:hypothetical protein